MESATRSTSLISTLLVLLLAGSVVGCGHNATLEVKAMTAGSLSDIGLTPPAPVSSIRAMCAPPLGWKLEPLKLTDRTAHQVWLSPSGNTAYGIIHITLPFPVGVNLVHWQFLREMRKKEGEAIDLGEDYDSKLPGLRFVAEGGLYKIRANMMLRGSEGWVAYAGTLRGKAVDPGELRLAEQARENTTPGMGSETSVE